MAKGYPDSFASNEAEEMLCEFDMFWLGEGFKAKGGECGHDFFVGNRHEVRVERVGGVWLV